MIMDIVHDYGLLEYDNNNNNNNNNNTEDDDTFLNSFNFKFQYIIFFINMFMLALQYIILMLPFMLFIC